MVMVLPAMTADSVEGGLLGGPGCANAVAAMRKLVQTKRRFVVMILLRESPCSGQDSPTG
jgi:hypothetical protein